MSLYSCGTCRIDLWHSAHSTLHLVGNMNCLEGKVEEERLALVMSLYYLYRLFGKQLSRVGSFPAEGNLMTLNKRTLH